MKISKKQNELIQAYYSGKHNIFWIVGGVGSSKTFGIMLLIDKLCMAVPNLRIACFRKSEKTLKQNLIPTYNKVIEASGNKQHIFLSNMVARYPNNSEIMFNWADKTKDPDCSNVKGLELTGCFFNEIDQIDADYYEIAKTRVGRWNQVELADGKGTIKPFIICDCNPTGAWPRNIYNQFIDNTLPEYIFFQESTAKDNPFLNKEYFKMLDTLPDAEKQRYIHGSWDYEANESQLITWENLKKVLVNNPMPEGETILSCDPSGEGKDSTALGYMKGDCFYRIETFPKVDETEIAHLIEERYKEQTINKIVIDSIGVGSGTLHTLRYASKKYPLYPFIAGESPDNTDSFYSFKNLKAQACWFLRESIQNESISIINNPELIREILSIEYKTDDRCISIISKKDLRKKLGRSSDMFDALMMANFHREARKLSLRKIIQNIDQYVTFGKDTAIAKHDSPWHSQILSDSKGGKYNLNHWTDLEDDGGKWGGNPWGLR